MKLHLLLLFIALNYTTVWAQDSTFVTIKAGSKIKDVLTATDLFLYPQFITGKVHLKDGTTSMAMMNYHSLNDQILFIDINGDTLALADEKTFKFIAIYTDTFYYDQGYVRLIVSNRVVKVVEKKTWEVVDIRKMGSHNRPSNSFAITSYSTLTDGFGKTHDLLLNEDLILRKKTKYYFGNNYNHFVAAGKKNLLSLFPKAQSSLADYLIENNINFDKVDDLEKLAHFLEQSH